MACRRGRAASGAALGDRMIYGLAHALALRGHAPAIPGNPRLRARRRWHVA
jgi:hypothetical protein